MKMAAVMLKDLRLICRDRFGLVALLIVPIVVITVVASATQSGDGSKSILFPIVNEDQGPVATALIRAFREHLDVREVTRATAQRLVADTNDAPAALILPRELSKRYLTQKPSTVQLLTDPAQWRELEAVKVVMLLADRETSSLGDPFSQELLTVRERNITGDHVSFSSLEQNIPGFSLMFVLLTLIFSVSLALREEEVWGTSARLSVAPMRPASLLGEAAGAPRRRHGPTAAASGLWSFRLRAQARALTGRDDPGCDGGGRFDDLFRRRRRRLCAYA
jgi:hypothetical protein